MDRRLDSPFITSAVSLCNLSMGFSFFNKGVFLIAPSTCSRARVLQSGRDIVCVEFTNERFTMKQGAFQAALQCVEVLHNFSGKTKGDSLLVVFEK